MLTMPLLACSLTALLAQDINHLNPPDRATSPAYTEAVTARPGTVIWIAGQVAQNAKGEVVAQGHRVHGACAVRGLVRQPSP